MRLASFPHGTASAFNMLKSEMNSDYRSCLACRVSLVGKTGYAASNLPNASDLPKRPVRKSLL